MRPIPQPLPAHSPLLASSRVEAELSSVPDGRPRVVFRTGRFRDHVDARAWASNELEHEHELGLRSEVVAHFTSYAARDGWTPHAIGSAMRYEVGPVVELWITVRSEEVELLVGRPTRDELEDGQSLYRVEISEPDSIDLDEFPLRTRAEYEEGRSPGRLTRDELVRELARELGVEIDLEGYREGHSTLGQDPDDRAGTVADVAELLGLEHSGSYGLEFDR